MVVIVDYGVGNLMAIQNIIAKVGGSAVISSDRETISQADKIVLPGVGSFDYCAAQLRQRDLIPILEDEVRKKKKPVLGLCVGAQLMTHHSEEGNVKGLGWVDAVTKKFDSNRVSIIPHMGWSDVTFVKHTPLTSGLGSESRFYFVHSYHFEFADTNQVVATAHFGYDFACAFQQDNIAGVQFHPEKSHRFGMKLFENFISV